MTAQIRNHVPDALLMAYASGRLAHAFSLVVASHVSMCDECRARLAAHETVGGAILDRIDSEDQLDGLKDRVWAQLDATIDAAPSVKRSGPFPAPVIEALGGKTPRWWSLGYGVKQCILKTDRSASARLLSIPPGQEVPDHGHRGLELTLVLQGSFEDEIDKFDEGDLEVADAQTEHKPVALGDRPCICLAATDAPLRFSSFVPRLLQPVFRI